MKNLKSITFIILLLIMGSNIKAQLKVRNDAFIQIGYDIQRTLSFGLDQNGNYAIEHYNNGLNFWKPWPTPNFGNFVLFLRDDHNIGIGTTGNTTYKLDIAGTSRSHGWFTISDERLKTNIKAINNGLEKILQLNGVQYNYDFELDKYSNISSTDLDEIKTKTMNGDNKITPNTNPRIGFIAQDLQQIVPEVVIEDDEGYLSINYSEIIPLLVESIKEQQSMISELENKVKVLNSTIQSSNKNQPNGELNQIEDLSSVLYKNYPNPFDNKTTIPYYISKKELSHQNYIYLYNQNGIEVKKFLLPNKEGKNHIEILTDELQNGIYIYSLVSNDMQMDSKTMIVTR